MVGPRAVPVLLVPLPAPAGGPPALAVYDLEAEGEREARDAVARLEREHAAAQAAGARRDRLLETCALVADRFGA